MATILLQRGSGNWLPFLLMLIAAVLCIKGIQWLIHFIKAKRMHRNKNGEDYVEHSTE